jgi:hypothetical protein
MSMMAKLSNGMMKIACTIGMAWDTKTAKLKMESFPQDNAQESTTHSESAVSVKTMQSTSTHHLTYKTGRSRVMYSPKDLDQRASTSGPKYFSMKQTKSTFCG